MRRKVWSAALACAMAVGLTSLPAMAAAPAAEVTEMTVGENTVFVYAPESDMVVSSTCTAPCFIVFGSEPYTAESAEVVAETSGLAELAAQEGATVVFVNPQGETWTEGDTQVYSTLIGMYSNSSTSTFVNGISNETNAMSGQTETKILGDTGRIYLYGEGTGADFVAANFMKNVVLDTTFPDGVTISFDRTPTSVTLFNPTALPETTRSPAALTASGLWTTTPPFPAPIAARPASWFPCTTGPPRALWRPLRASPSPTAAPSTMSPITATTWTSPTPPARCLWC